MRHTPHVVATAIALLFATAQAPAQTASPLRAAVEKAVLGNPEVTARFNAYRAAGDATDAAKGGFLPRVDLSANVGRESDKITSRAPETQSFTRTGVALSLTQLLWDGLGTSREVDRVNHDKLARYFELLDVTEQTALEAARAHYDVIRYRKLVQLAEDNYVQHRYAFNQIQSRYKAGVGRGVDLEQANARLALAQSNLTTEASNLHDVTARYQRVVGEAPPAATPALTLLDQQIPAASSEVLDTAVRQSAAISASIESLRGVRSGVQVRDSAFQPRVEARLRAGGGKNFDAVLDEKRATSAQIVLDWNLFNGGSDQARVRQQTNLLGQATDLRDKACRDARQTTAIAFNDTRKLTEQLVLLDRNTLAIEKARDAYRQQFDIGQRSLLDLLNAENEVYTARRSYTNAEYDRAVAYARTHAAMTQLTRQLGVARADKAAEDAANWSAGDDAPTRCPADTVQVAAVDTAVLDQRVPTTASPATPSGVKPSALPAATPIAPMPAASGGVPASRLNDWAAAWEAKDASRYLGFYSPSFAPSKGSLKSWQSKRRVMVTKKGPIGVKLNDVKSTTLADGSVETSFIQNYSSANFNDVSSKTLTWKQVGGQWLIVKESNR